jgi:hypothetical protein
MQLVKSSMFITVDATCEIFETSEPGFALFAWLISHQPAVLFSQNKPATSNQPAILFSQNKPAPAISHQPTEQARFLCYLEIDMCEFLV